MGYVWIWLFFLFLNYFTLNTGLFYSFYISWIWSTMINHQAVDSPVFWVAHGRWPNSFTIFKTWAELEKSWKVLKSHFIIRIIYALWFFTVYSQNFWSRTKMKFMTIPKTLILQKHNEHTFKYKNIKTKHLWNMKGTFWNNF